MAANVDAIKEFPSDGRRWWIRYVDRYTVPHKRSASRAVKVVLSAIPDTFDALPLRSLDQATIYARSDGEHEAHVLVGMLPRLVIGAVFQDQVQIGHLPHDVKTFRFDRKDTYVGIHKAKDNLLNIRPGWMDKPYPAIHKTFYPLGHHSGWHCLVLHKEEYTLVIPCHEILRTWYAPDQHIANALFRGPWEGEWKTVANPDGTGVDADGLWHIQLRTKIKNDFARILANLILNPEGRRAAAKIYAQLAENPVGTQIGVNFPFEWDRLIVRMACVKQTTASNKFLGLHIRACSWPDSRREIFIKRDNSGEKGAVETPVERPVPYTTADPVEDDEGPVTVTSEDDPMIASGEAAFVVPGMELIGAPRLVNAPKDESFIYEKPSIPVKGDGGQEAASPGDEHWGDSGLLRSKYMALQRRDAATRFLLVAQLLDRLRDAGHIDGWVVERPPQGGHYRGALEVWPVPTPEDPMVPKPKPPAWVYLDRERTVRRTALVCRISAGGGALWWLELETRETEGGYRYVLFTADDGAVESVTTALLTEAVRESGVWPSPSELIEASGALSVECCKHSYLGEEGSDTKPRVLSATKLLRVLGCTRTEEVPEHPTARVSDEAERESSVNA